MTLARGALEEAAPDELAIFDAAEAVEAAADEQARELRGLLVEARYAYRAESAEEGRQQLEKDRADVSLAQDLAELAVSAARERLKEVAPGELANYQAARYAFRAADGLFDEPPER